MNIPHCLTNPIEQLIDDAIRAATPDGATRPTPVTLASASALQLAPFIEQMGNPSGTRKEFWWEREWRHVGDLQFAKRDLVVVFAPEQEHSTLRGSLAADPDYEAVLLRLMDAQWGLERMIATLAGVSDHGPFPQ